MAITRKNRDGQVETTYAGRVLRTFQRDYRAMSDVYTLATYADVVTDDGKIETVMVNANFECDQSGGCAEVDANPAARLVEKFWDDLYRAELSKIAEQRAKEAEERVKNSPTRGKRMEVTKGKHKGLVGTVATVLSNGRVLLKKDHEWQNRQANGEWVNPGYLKAV
jgi:hypothetical protein